MTVTMKSCLVCHAQMQARKPWLWRCGNCGFLHSTLPAGPGTGVSGLEALRRANFQMLLDRVAEHATLQDRTIAEAGCSSGLFLEAAAARGAKVLGVEPETAKAALARAKGYAVRDGFFPDALQAQESFDFLVFNDVFEHLPDPVAALAACERHLNPGGCLLINLPDSGGILYRIADVLDRLGIGGPLERLWQNAFASPHITYFNRHNMRKLVADTTSLQLLGQFELDSMARAGLKERVSASSAEPWASLITGCLALVIPLQRILPSDIRVFVFRKPGA